LERRSGASVTQQTSRPGRGYVAASASPAASSAIAVTVVVADDVVAIAIAHFASDFATARQPLPQLLLTPLLLLWLLLSLSLPSPLQPLLLSLSLPLLMPLSLPQLMSLPLPLSLLLPLPLSHDQLESIKHCKVTARKT
jgi:hypothetical protein